MFRSIGMVCLLGISLAAAAQQPVRYVSDELAIVLRASAGSEGASLGVLTSGARVEVLSASAGSNGYAQVRAADGREGWVLERYLKDEPIARERLQRAEKELATARQDQAAARRELAETQAELKKTKDEHARLLQDFSRIAGNTPASSAAALKEAEQLRLRVQQLEQEQAQLLNEAGGARGEQRTLLLGGALVAGGVLLALLLHWLWPKRRWGDL